MSAGGFANTLRRTLAVALTLMTLAVGMLWGDSYRRRVNAVKYFHCNLAVGIQPPRRFPSPPKSFEDTGLDASWTPGKNGTFSIRTWAGQLSLHFSETIACSLSVRDVDASIAGVAYEQRSATYYLYPVTQSGTIPSQPSGTVCYRGRSIALPLWMPAALCAIYPTLHLLGGPMLRRRFRRKRGLCAACGYDMSHSQNRCPECGATVEHAPAPSATDQ